jgi:phosphoglycolate phosphatase
LDQLVYIPILAIIFDFDGTLVDTKRYYLNLVAQYLEVDLDQFVSTADKIYFSKLSHEERNIKWKILKAIYVTSRALGISYIKIVGAFNHLRRNHSKRFSDARPTKDAYRAVKKLHSNAIKLGIVSHSSRKKVLQFLNKYFDGDKYFSSDSILASGEFGKSKENGLIHFLRKFKLTDTPRSCAIVGDLGGDIIAGKTVGMTTFGITTGYSTLQILRKCSPDAIYGTLLEMEKSIYLFFGKEK